MLVTQNFINCYKLWEEIVSVYYDVISLFNNKIENIIFIKTKFSSTSSILLQRNYLDESVWTVTYQQQ